MAYPVQRVLRGCTKAACSRNDDPPLEGVSALTIAGSRRNLLGAAVQQEQFLRVAAVEGQFHDARGFHDLADGKAARLDQSRVGLNLDLFRNLAHLEHDLDRRIAVDLQDNTRLHECAKARQSRLESVLA